MAGITHAAQSLVFGCDFPDWMHWALIIYAATILLLFLNFYFHAYVKAQQKKVTILLFLFGLLTNKGQQVNMLVP